jgi:hypothetical protein
MKTKIIVCSINLILVGIVIGRVMQIDNDKGHLVYMFYVPFFALVNFLIGLVLKLLKSPAHKAFWIASLFLLILYIPGYVLVLSLISY